MKLLNKSERGATLIVVLIVLVVLLIGATALYNSSRSGVKLSGNIASKQSSILVGDIAIVKAKAYIVALTSKDTTVANKYYSTMQASNAIGIPTVINWANVATETVNNVRLQYVIDRMCTTSPITDRNGQCYISLSNDVGGGGSLKAGQAQVLQGQTAVYYRVTVRVSSDSGVENIIQALITA